MKKLNILFIEDDAIEQMKFDRVLENLHANHHVTEAQNGEEALSILASQKELPDIILLDINMPRMDGIEFLSLLKADEKLKFLPTIILTTSNNSREVLKCYEIGIAGYIVKPLKYEDYIIKIQNLLNYWSYNELITFNKITQCTE